MSELVEAFVGGMYQAQSPTFAADLAINLVPETRRVEGGAKTRVLTKPPGLTLLATAADNRGCRGIFTPIPIDPFQRQAPLVVFGTTVYRYDSLTQTLTSKGTIPYTVGVLPEADRVFFATNGRGGDQVAIVGGGELHIFDFVADTYSAAIVLPFSLPVMVTFIDGYFLINQEASPIVWYSALEDGTSWDGLDFFARSGTSDDIVAIGVCRNRLWVFGADTTTAYYDSGDADTPFLPYPESVVQAGVLSALAFDVQNDTFSWVAQTSNIGPYVARAQGDTSPTRISTPPIEEKLRAMTSLGRNVQVFSYTVPGHAFVVLLLYGLEEDVQVYVWDDTEKLWHARAGWDEVLGVYTRWRPVMVVQGQGPTLEWLTLAGDWENGNLYELDPEAQTDNEVMIRWQRRMPYLSTENQWAFLHSLELGCQVGVGLSSGQGSDPVCTLQISRDAAKTWVNAGDAIMGAQGEYEARTIWRQLGRSRMDRFVFDVSGTEPVFTALTGVWLNFKLGTGQL